MSLVYLKHKKSSVTYVYECKSFWNKERKRPDSKRTCIGKLHSTTGELIRVLFDGVRDVGFDFALI
jgi:hypothetical protein